ncbi:MAG: hypothetical protein WD512_13700 [Candidatus Paceibacterota bacterium]
MNKLDKSLLGTYSWYYRKLDQPFSSNGIQDEWRNPNSTLEDLLSVLPQTAKDEISEGDRFELKQYQCVKLGRATRAEEFLITTYTFLNNQWVCLIILD